jgi:alcohol dehydrogenase class IV
MVFGATPLRRALPSPRRLHMQWSRAVSTAFDLQPGQLSASGQPMRVVFGAKAAAEQLGLAARAAGVHRMLVVRDRDAGAASRTQYAEFLLMQAGIPCFQFTLPRDCATVESVELGVETAVRIGADGVLAFGGGSTADMARSIALLLANDYSVKELLEVR